MPDKKPGDQRAEEHQDDKKGHSILVEDQASFMDEGSRAGKQFADGGRKVADLERVGAMSPDSDADVEEEPDRPPTQRK